jgi:hypothetical protein
MGNRLEYIVAPDYEHHMFVHEWAHAFPGAKIIGVEGLPEKREKSLKNPADKVPFSYVFTKQNKGSIKIGDDFDRDFEYEYLQSHPNKELVFFYKPDKTLIEADYLFNCPPIEQYSKSEENASDGFFTRLFQSLQSTEGKAMAQKRFQWYGMSAKDRKAFDASTRRIHQWDFQRIIPCHGDVIENNAKGIFEKVFEWHLQDKKSA